MVQLEDNDQMMILLHLHLVDVGLFFLFGVIEADEDDLEILVRVVVAKLDETRGEGPAGRAPVG